MPTDILLIASVVLAGVLALIGWKIWWFMRLSAPKPESEPEND